MDLSKIFSGIKAFGITVFHVITGAARVNKVIKGMTDEQKAAMVNLLKDVLAIEAASAGALAAGGKNIALDCAVVSEVENLVNDAKQGVTVAKQLFDALGIEV